MYEYTDIIQVWHCNDSTHCTDHWHSSLWQWLSGFDIFKMIIILTVSVTVCMFVVWYLLRKEGPTPYLHACLQIDSLLLLTRMEGRAQTHKQGPNWAIFRTTSWQMWIPNYFHQAPQGCGARMEKWEPKDHGLNKRCEYSNYILELL